MAQPQSQLEEATSNGVSPSSDETELTQQVLQSRLNELQASTELDETAKGNLAPLYQQALEHLTAAQELAGKVAQWKTEIAEAPTALVQAKRALAASGSLVEPVDDPKIPLPDLEQSLAQAEKALSEAREERDGYEQQLDLLERKSEIDKLIAEVQKQLKEIESQLSAIVPEGEPPAATLARRSELRARQLVRQRQLTAYTTELARIEALGELWTLRRDLGMRRVKELESYVRTWQAIVSDRRKAETERKLREALRELEDAHPALETLVKTTFDLAAERVKLADQLDLASRQVDIGRKLLPDVQQRRETAVAMDRVASHVATIGLAYRTMRDELPDVEAVDDLLRFLAREIPRVNLRLLNLREQRTELGDQDQSTREALAALQANSPEAEIRRIEPLVREALARQRASLDILLEDYQKYANVLASLNEIVNPLYVELTAFIAFIDERILWVRSAEMVGAEDFRESRDALSKLFHPDAWREALGLAIDRIWRHPTGAVVILAGWSCLFLVRRRLRAALKRLSEPEEGSILLTGRATATAILLTTIIASVWPLLIWSIGQQLGHSIDEAMPSPATFALQPELAAVTTETVWAVPKTEGAMLADALAAALTSIALVYWLLDLVRHVFRRNGLAEKHLAWDHAAASLVRSAVRYVMLIALPILFFLTLVDNYDDGVWQYSLGRIGFIAAMIVLVIILNHLFRPGRGTLDALWSGNHAAWMHRFRRLVWLLVLLCPVALAVLAAVGFNYSAHQVAVRLIETLWLLLLLLFCRSLVARWLFIKQWTLARRFAEQRAAEAASQAADDALDEPGTAQSLNSIAESAREVLRQEEQSALETIDTQLRHLLRLGVAFALLLGVWFIWHDTFPALRALDRISIWPAAQSATAAVEPVVDAELPPDAASTEPALQADPALQAELPIAGTSLADLLLTLAIAVVTFLAGRNVPGLLEVLLLERLPLNSGARNAVTTLCGYAIMLGGVLIGCNVMGLEWQSVQWLAAALTVGLGFGLQEIFANFVSGLILLFERPIRVGDVITLDDVTGTVTKIKIRATTITNWDRQELVVPNKDLVTGRLLNWTLADRTNRLVINVGVAYGSDTQRVHDLILQIADEHPDVLQDPAASVTFEDFGDSTLNFTLRCFLSALGDRLPVRHAINSAIHKQFAAEGIEIAFPQRDIHIRSHISLPPGDLAPGAGA